MVFQLFASEINGQLEAAKLCGTPDDLSDIGCIDIVNPVSTVEVEEVYIIVMYSNYIMGR